MDLGVLLEVTDDGPLETRKGATTGSLETESQDEH